MTSITDVPAPGGEAGPRPLCFMVMPFRRKDTRAAAPAPATVDFDALWDKAFRPALESIGYEAVRADQDLGALIIKEMLERLYFSDLVLADLTIPNGNVYYEIGIRHAAKSTGCVLVGADWSSPLFDVDQMRQVRYPLPEGEVTDATASAIRTILQRSVPAMAASASPMFQTLSGYPDNVRADRVDVIRTHMRRLSEFQASARAVALAPKAERQALALGLARRYPPTGAILPAVAFELVMVLRDHAEWRDALDYIDRLPESLRELPLIEEQRSLALSKDGNHRAAIAALEQLVADRGETSERLGLIGGRYKRLAAAESNAADRARLLNKAIDAYERGMRADLNDYFPSSNLARLYRARDRRGDEERARASTAIALAACLRAKARTPSDEWVRPTLLGVAFDAGDVERADDLSDEVVTDASAGWKLETMIDDLAVSVGQQPDPGVRGALEDVLARVKALL